MAAQTGADEDQCEKAIQRTLHAGSRARDPKSGRPLFAFRLHQFLSKGDTVYVTLEDENTRHITRDYQVEQPGSGGKVLLPLAFCRECGQEYLVVWRRDRSGAVSYLAGATQPSPRKGRCGARYRYRWLPLCVRRPPMAT